jgi:hypothetical protein
MVLWMTLCSLVRGYQLSEENAGSIFTVEVCRVSDWLGNMDRLQGRWSLRPMGWSRIRSPVREYGNDSHWLSSSPLRWVWVTAFLPTRIDPSPYILQPWSWKNHVPPKRRYPPTRLYDIISQETTIWSGKVHSNFELIDIPNTCIFFAILHVNLALC